MCLRARSLHVSSTPPAGGAGFDAVGRVDAARLTDLVPDLDAEFHLCGPVSFVADFQAGLVRRGVPTGRIHTEGEGIGPVGLP